MSKSFDLIYVREGNEGRMTVAVFDEGNVADAIALGPFSGPTMGGDAVTAMLAADLGFPDRKTAELEYATRHFFYMSQGQNRAGQSYPFRVPSAD